MKLEKNDTELLEALIDKHGLTYVVAGLALICFEKGAHLDVNWQDRTTARVWEADGKKLEACARTVQSDG